MFKVRSFIRKIVEYLMADFTDPPTNSSRELKFWGWCGDIADDATITFPTVTDQGTGILSTTDTTGRCYFFIDNTGTVIKSTNSVLIVSNQDTDTKICMGTAATQNPLLLKNRVGAATNVIVLFWYK